MNKFDVCIFDLDGTLTNSLTDLANCMNESLELHSLPTHPLKEYAQFVGKGITNLVTTAMGAKASDKELFTSVYKAFNMLYDEKCLAQTQPYIGIPELLISLKQRGVKICVLSNKNDVFANRIVTSLFGENTFDLIWGKKNEYPTKPEPDSLHAMLKELNCPFEKCLYIGDSNIDLLTARNAGVTFCGVEWGFRGKQELIDNGAKIIVKKPAEIAKLVAAD